MKLHNKSRNFYNSNCSELEQSWERIILSFSNEFFPFVPHNWLFYFINVRHPKVVRVLKSFFLSMSDHECGT